jgi:hypothetical protein
MEVSGQLHALAAVPPGKNPVPIEEEGGLWPPKARSSACHQPKISLLSIRLSSVWSGIHWAMND